MLEAVDAAQHGHPGLLHDLVGVRVGRDVHPRRAVQGRVVPIEEPREGSLVAVAKRIDQLRVVGVVAGRRRTP